MNKKKRVSLSIRLQPYENTLVAEVADWLNSIEKDEKNRLIADAIVMAYLPYARASKKVATSEVERCCWETQNMLDKHGFNIRQALQVDQPQWHSNVISQGIKQDSFSNGKLISLEDPKVEPTTQPEIDGRESAPHSLIKSSGASVNNSCFDDDEFE